MTVELEGRKFLLAAIEASNVRQKNLTRMKMPKGVIPEGTICQRRSCDRLATTTRRYIRKSGPIPLIVCAECAEEIDHTESAAASK